MLIAFCSLFSARLQAQDIVALHPFRGTPETSAIANQFFQRMQQELPGIASGAYRGFPIDLSRLPPDVPEGGFPPWICPSPSITGAAAFAITGEAGLDPDFPDATRVRLYLWMLDGARLLGSDEMTVFDSGDLNGIPGFLEWVMSWIREDAEAEAEVVYIYEQGEYFQQYWLNLGLRGGGGYSRWTYDHRENMTTHEVSSLASANIALQTALHFSRFFALQPEAELVYDFRLLGSDDDSFSALSLNVPVLLKLMLQGEKVVAGIFGGVYLHVPLSQEGEYDIREYFEYKADFPGIVFGLSAGWRVGSGNLFIDGRFKYDGHWFDEELERINYRNSIRLNIGYEIGLIRKR